MPQPVAPFRILGQEALNQLPQAIALRNFGKKLLIVCDDETWKAAGERLVATLSPTCEVVVHHLGRTPRACAIHAQSIIPEIQQYEGVIALGSGTINDLVKYAVFEAKKHYISVATAASMNGYSSANASLMVDDIKQSLPAMPPLCVVGDSDILVNAPKRLTRAGLGDMLCRTTVEADMLLSHFLFDTPYPADFFASLRNYEPTLLKGLSKAGTQEAMFVMGLFEALLDGGDAMTAMGSSAPASQGEHMIAHLLEWKYGTEIKSILHGELIAITTITMSQLQSRLIITKPKIKSLPYEMATFERVVSAKHAEALSSRYAKKYISPALAEALNAKINHHWDEWRKQFQAIMIPTNTLERAFIHSNASTKPEQIGIAEERYRYVISNAHLTRDRFTFLDLAVMNGVRPR